MAVLKPSDYPLWFWLVVVITLLLFAVNLFFFLAPEIAFVTWVGKAGISGKELLTGVGALIGSFVGAWFAFRFAQYQRKQEKHNGEVAAGNLALFTLTVMFSELRQHQKEIVEPYRGKADAWLNLHVSQPLNPNLRFEIKDLVFVMQADAAVFQQLLLEESRFQLAAYLIEEHRRLALVETWPRLGGLLRCPRSLLQKDWRIKSSTAIVFIADVIVFKCYIEIDLDCGSGVALLS